MPRKIKFLLALLLVGALLLTGCGDVRNTVFLPHEPSEYHSDEDILAAAESAKIYFSLGFTDCSMEELRYIGDAGVRNEAKSRGLDPEDVIVLESTFKVGASGGDGSMTPNSTYKKWKWVLVPNFFGKWRVESFGYG